MSLSSALSNALTGLRTNSRDASVVGDNLANALNDNYSRREITRTSRSGDTGGVTVSAVTRVYNQTVAADWRAANADETGNKMLFDAQKRIGDVFGEPGAQDSLGSLVTRLETKLLSAASRPDLDIRLSDVASAMGQLVGKINRIGDAIQEERLSADRSIARSVEDLNKLLGSVEELNASISARRNNDEVKAGMLERRDQAIDKISDLMDVRIYTRENNQIAIYTSGGTALLDGSAVEVAFTPTPEIEADMTLGSGALSALTIGGRIVDAGLSAGEVSGGRIGAAFDIRDRAAVNSQSEIDALAFDLTARLNNPLLDPTRSPADPGLMLDLSSPVAVVNIDGLSSRLTLNASVDPSKGGDPRLLRDGLLSATPGPVGNADMVSGLADALSSSATIARGSFANSSMTLATLASNIGSTLASDLNRAEDAMVGATARRTSSAEMKLRENGVDSDQELQRLMQVQQAYAANAKVIQTIDEMLDSLMRAV